MVLAEAVRVPVVRPRRYRGLRALLVAVFVAMLSTGVVATSGPASAADAATLLEMMPKVLGPTAAVGAEEVTAGLVCATGVGCLALGAAAVGMGLYATSDYWLPWLENQFGGGGAADSETPGAPINASWAPLLDGAVDASPGGIASLSITAGQAGAAGLSMTETVNVYCKQTQFNPDHGSAHVGDVVIESHGASHFFNSGETWNPTYQCSGMGIITYIQTVAAAGGGGPSANQVSWGEPGVQDTTTYQATVQCVQADGTQVSLAGPTTPNSDGGLTVPSCAAAGLGSHAASVNVTGKVGSSAPSTVWSSVPKVDTAYPQCDPGAVTVCKFSVTYKGSECTVGAAGCMDWARQSQSNTSDYGCLWGPYTMPLSSCSVQERAYETGTETGVQATPANTDGDPATATDPNGDPIPGGDPAPVDPGPSDPSPSTNTATPSPTISGPTDPRIPTEDQPTVNACWPNGWSAFNPASWVLMPIKCALKWAFVPDGAAIQTSIDGVSGVWSNSDWGKWGGALGGIGSALATDPPDDCRGPGLDVNASWVGIDQTVYPFNACSGAAATVATIIRDGVSCALVAAGALACVRLLMAGMSYGGFSSGGGD